MGWVIASLLLGLRVAPVFALAPPFSFTRVPTPMRALFGFGVAACLVTSRAPVALVTDFEIGPLAVAALRELLVGVVFVLAFQIAFAGLYMAGRTLDIQAGFGLAVLIDPSNNTQTPLIGTIYAYAAAAAFFALGGHHDLLRILAASLDIVPIGTGHAPPNLDRLASFISAVFLTSFGVAGGAVLALFLADLTISLMARTMPQMNVLVLGFQLKTLVLLIVLPTTFGLTAAMLVRLMRFTLSSLPGLL